MFDAAAYRDQLQQLLPPGPAWPRDEDAGLTLLLDAIAQEFGRLDARAERLHDEADPRTTLELLTDWERIVGLPDACAGSIAITVPERRSAIVQKLTSRGGQSIAYLTSLAASLGYAIAVEEFQPSRAGNARSGDRCQGIEDWAFAFRLDVLPPGSTPADPLNSPTLVDLVVNITYARAGTARAGDRVRSFGSSAIECVIRRAKPAHTAVIFAYPPADEPVFLFDFTLS